MAFTVSSVTQSVMGKYRLAVLDVTPDSAEGSIDTGLKRITWSISTLKKGVSFVASGNTSYTLPNFVENAGTTGTVAAGFLGISGVVATAIYRVTAFGPS